MASADLDAALDTFADRVVGRAISEATYTDYEKWIRRFEAWLEQSGMDDPDIAELEDFDNFLADESRTDYPWDDGTGQSPPPGYAYRSRVNAASAVKLWVRRQYGTRIPETPDEICLGEPEPFDPTYLQPSAVGDTTTSAGEDCDIDGCGTALRLSYDAILRASELVRIRREDVDLDAGTVYVRATKGSQNAEVGVDSRTLDALQAHMEANPGRERLFVNSYDRAWKPSAWATHVWRSHTDAGSHAIGRHSPIMHRLEGASPGFMDAGFGEEDFGDVFRRARHHTPSMTVRYARVVGISVPEWAEE
jgi:integrase